MTRDSDTYSVVTATSWANKVGGAFTGAFVGLVLIAIAAWLLFWNEGRTVKTARTLEEGAASVVSAPADHVEAANDKKLVHVTGEAATEEKLVDKEFGVAAQAVKLARKVETYQWKETATTETRRKVGGGEDKITTYSYAKAWNEGLIDSSNFQKPQGHANPPTAAFVGKTRVAGKVTLGAFAVPASVLAKLDTYELCEMTETDRQRIPASLRSRVKLVQGQFYIPVSAAAAAALGPEAREDGGAATNSPPASPQDLQPRVGDTRISFQQVPQGPISVIAGQVGNTFEPYPASTGNTVELVAGGIRSAKSMFASEMESNRTLTWVLRGVGFLLMFVGLVLLMRPLSAIADVLPILGSLVSAGTGIVAFILAAAFSLAIIAVAWVAARPVAGYSLLAGAALLFVLALARGRAKRRTRA